ncbi:hypothetical protein F2Q68_00043499 [Brassica cretica]|uniref:Uncharacterized protein n=1 Tax=Brassica cretica TaxID=69181 RepID=A0A8S9LMD6_BRACR|nr:hypothetical protein F2Q68_00043499 [Brassica cretica]
MMKLVLSCGSKITSSGLLLSNKSSETELHLRDRTEIIGNSVRNPTSKPPFTDDIRFAATSEVVEERVTGGEVVWWSNL